MYFDDTINHLFISLQQKVLQKLLNPSFFKPLVPTPFTNGGGGGASRPLKLSQKAVVPMNVKFCRVLETPLKVLEMLKLFIWCLLDYHSNPSKEVCFGRKSLDFS